MKCTETSKDAPEWFGVLEKPASKIAPEKAPTFNGTLTYLSKIQGWITVTPKNKNRSRPLEKAKIVIFLLLTKSKRVMMQQEHQV